MLGSSSSISRIRGCHSCLKRDKKTAHTFHGPDPIGGSLADYEETKDRIRDALEARVEDWF